MKTTHLDIKLFTDMVVKPPVKFSVGWGLENAVGMEFRERWARLAYEGAQICKSNAKGGQRRGLWGRQLRKPAP